jgi:EpsI family protein
LAGRSLAGWDPAFPGADSQLLRGYQAPEGEVALFIAHYLYQRDGHEIIATRNSFVGRGRDNQVTRFERLDVALADRSQTLRETLVQTPAGPRLIWSWYEIGGTLTISPIAGKFIEIWHTLNGGSRAATAFALSTVAGDDLRGTRARLKAFLSALEANQGLGVALAQTGKSKTANEARNKESQ